MAAILLLAFVLFAPVDAAGATSAGTPDRLIKVVDSDTTDVLLNDRVERVGHVGVDIQERDQPRYFAAI